MTADWRDESEYTNQRTAADVYQDDVLALLEALDLGTHARPKSPHAVVQDEVLPAIKQMRNGLDDIMTKCCHPVEDLESAEYVISQVNYLAHDALDAAEGSDDG